MKSGRILNPAGYEGREFLVTETAEGLSFELPANTMYAILDTRPSNVPTGLLENENRSIKIYPNPNHGNFLIEFLEPSSNIVHVELINMNGKLVKRIKYEQSQNIKIQLSTGMYIVRLQMNDGSINTHKLLVN